MIKLTNFIDNNLTEFNSLTDSEVLTIDPNTIDSEIVDYLKTAYRNRFDYKNICVYYYDDMICVENCIY